MANESSIEPNGNEPQVDDTRKSNQGTPTFDPGALEGPSAAAYSRQGEAQGGWVQFPQDTEGEPRAVGAESLMTPRMPYDSDLGGLSYTITALAGNGSNVYGYADANRLVDVKGQKSWYDNWGVKTTNGDGDVETQTFGVVTTAKRPTTSAIINWAAENSVKKVKNGAGGNKRPYKYKDFVFCKYWNKIPNNYQITLRRFQYPVFDNLEFPGENGSVLDSSITPQEYYTPFAQAITFMGDGPGNALSDMLKYNVALPYKDAESKVHQVDQQSPGADAGPAPGLAKVLGVLTGEADFNTISNNGAKPPDPYQNGPYMNRVLGPINVIKGTKQREAGLNFTQSFSLKFHYVARPIGGVNTKAAMLDIMANMLALTYAEGAFWGGAHRFTGGSPAYPFLGGKAGMNALYSGDIAGFTDALTTQMTKAAENVGEIFNSLLSDPIEGLKKLAAGGLKMGLAKSLAGKKQQLRGLPALLTGNPVGEWHLTVGNPFNPLMEVGNLICTGCDFEFGKELGPDDFPLELICTVKLEHGMKRDKAAIESMFNRGKGKIYHLPDDFQFPGRSTIDAATGTNNTSSKKLGGSGKGTNSTQRKSMLQGDAAVIDNLATSLTKAPKSIIEGAKVGYGYYNGPTPKDGK